MKIILLLSLFFSACANNLSQNSVDRSKRTFSGGVYRDQEWKDNMTFTRVSWYQELTMLYDVWFFRLPDNSPFRLWFSKEELRQVSECKDLIIGFHYQYESKRISDLMFKAEMELNKYEDLYLSQFNKNLTLHPDRIKWQLQKHKPIAFCKTADSDEPIVINFPGFKEISIALPK